MFDISNEIIEVPKILQTIEKLKNEQILIEDAFKDIYQVLKVNLEYFSAKKNIRNALTISEIIISKLCPNDRLSHILINDYNQKKYIPLTDDNDFGLHTTKSGKRISFNENSPLTPAITMGCDWILYCLKKEPLDLETIKTIEKLLKYIESTGDMPLPEDIQE